MTDALDVKVRNAPRSPGVYLMKDGAGGILYVGKARDLRLRVRAYFARTDARAMIPFLVSKIRDIEFIVTGTEKEALILENNLIKENRPRYNVDFRDDKAYFNIRIDPAEPFARFQLVRRPKRDGARYFGPYPSSGAARQTLQFLQSIFLFRTCRDRELQGRRRPCLEHQIGRCPAPCTGRIDAAAYGRLVQEGIAFLEGRENALLADLRAQMDAAAEALRFEEAAMLRDRIAAIEATLERQRIVSAGGRNRDLFGLYREGDTTQVALLFIRDGRMIGQKLFPLIHLRAPSAELLSSLLMRYYDAAAEIPAEIVLPVALADAAVLQEWLADKRGRAVALTVPRRGEVRELLAIAGRNAKNAFQTARLVADRPEAVLPLLAEKLQLHNLPRRIECFDISNIGGQQAVGSLVVFTAGVARKADYRRFRIRTVPGADDYAMMYEVIRRRYEGRESLPDLIVVDGGRGQLGVALAVLKDLGIEGVDVIALAKERDAAPTGDRAGSDTAPAGPGRSEDRVFLPGRKDPIYLSRWPSALFLLQRVRDEAHRFALSYHRKVREKEVLRSLLDRIPGIGPARRQALLAHFGDLRRVRTATPAELMAVTGIGRGAAHRIRSFLDGEAGSPVPTEKRVDGSAEIL